MNQVLEKWLPQEPHQGPPLPEWMGIYWPWYKVPTVGLRANTRYLGVNGLETTDFVRGDTVTCEVTVINEGTVSAKNVWVIIMTSDKTFAGEEKAVFPARYDIAPGASQVFTNSQVIPADAPLGPVRASGAIGADNAPDVVIPFHTAYTIVEIVASLFGRVVDGDTGSLLAGVKVTLTAEIAQTYTGTDGRFRFDGLPLGEYTVFFEKEGYEATYRFPVVLVAGDNDLGNIFIMPSTTTLSFRGPTYG